MEYKVSGGYAVRAGEVITRVQEQNIVRPFLALPKRLYPKDFLVQDASVEKQLLTGKHPLSGDFTIYPYVVADETGKTIGRCILTIYPNDTIGYVGLFECEENVAACRCLLEAVNEKAYALGMQKLCGPLDASFWIRYRFKVSHFDHLYTGEPYNLEYYAALWEQCGFAVINHYSSNQGRIPEAEDVDAKCVKRYQMALDAGITFRHPTKKSFFADLAEVYDLLIQLYSGFPGYRFITKEQFLNLFSSLKFVLNYDMVFLAYSQNQLQGFFINIPNYGNATSGAITPAKLLRILRMKKRPKEYILLYMGVAPQSAGLAAAFSQMVKDYLQENRQSFIGALILDGKVTNHFYKQLNYDRYEYVLMEKSIGMIKE